MEIPLDQLKEKEYLISNEEKETKIIDFSLYRDKLSKYSNYTNITYKNTSKFPMEQKKSNELIFEGLANIDLLKYKYYVFKDAQNIKINESSLIWEEFKSFDIKLGINKVNTNLSSLDYSYSTGIEINSKIKNNIINFTTITVNAAEKSRIKVFVNDFLVSNLIINKGNTTLSNIPLKFGTNLIKIKTYDLTDNLIKEKQLIISPNKNNPKNWARLNSYQFNLGKTTNQDDQNEFSSSIKLDTLFSPVNTFTKLSKNLRQYSFELKPFNILQYSSGSIKNMTSGNKSTYADISFNKSFETTNIIQKINLSAATKKTFTQQKKNDLQNFSSYVDFKEKFNIQPSIFIKHQISDVYDNSQVIINLGWNYEYDNQRNLIYQNNINLKIDKDNNKDLLLSIGFNNNIQFKQNNILYNLSISENEFSAFINIFWIFDNITRVDTKIGMNELSNSIDYKNKKQNFIFNAKNTIISNQNLLSAGYRFNEKTTNTNAKFQQDLSSKNRVDSLSFFNDFTSILYNFENKENAHYSDLTIKTAIAFVDGYFGVKNNINNSFLIIKPREKIKNATLIANEEKNFLFNSLVLTNLQEDSLNNIEISIESKNSLLQLPQTNYSVPIQRNKGEVLIIDAESSNIAITTLLDQNNEPLSYKTITFFEKDKQKTKQTILSSKKGKVQLIGVKAGRTYIIESNIDGLLPLELNIPKWVNGLYQIKELKFKKEKETN